MVEDYFVRITDVKFVERRRLEVARKILLCSAAYLSLKDIRAKKSQLTTYLKEQMESIADLFHTLESCLPHQELLNERPVSQEKESSSLKPISSSVNASSHKMDKLQEAIALIEKKIESLDL